MKNTIRLLGSTILAASLAFSACADTGKTILPVSFGGSSGDAVVSINAIPGVVVPVRGAVPSTTPIETAQYTGTVAWSPDDTPFEPETEYTATIVLTAKDGFTLTGVTGNSFIVPGASSVNAADSGDVTAVFPATGAMPDIDVAFISASETGGASGTADSTGLTLTFDADPTALTADNITVTGATKGALSGSGTTRSLGISNITVANEATVSVTITSPAGYAITGSPHTAVVYRAPVDVTFIGAIQIGGISGVAVTTGLILVFDVDPMALTADDITVTGATKGTLSGTGNMRILAISNLTVANGETVPVSIATPTGYSIIGSPQTAVVYQEPYYIGMSYQGGVIAYILQSGDPGYVPGETHGIIAATSDQSTGIKWSTQPTLVPGGTGTALGTGFTNTVNIIALNGAGTDYAAGLARAYQGGGYTDWYLPSKDELNILFVNRVAIGGFIDDGYYWSSSEYDGSGGALVWVQWFGHGQNGTDKFCMWGVRAVRAF